MCQNVEGKEEQTRGQSKNIFLFQTTSVMVLIFNDGDNDNIDTDLQTLHLLMFY